MRKYIFIKKKLKIDLILLLRKVLLFFRKHYMCFFLLKKMNNFYAKKLDLVFIKEKECFYEKRFQI